jgi:hypothetical protein
MARVELKVPHGPVRVISARLSGQKAKHSIITEPATAIPLTEFENNSGGRRAIGGAVLGNVPAEPSVAKLPVAWRGDPEGGE